MTERALGLIETKGYVGLVQATDAMAKAGRVSFVRQEHIGGGFVTTMVQGDVGAVRAAVDAGISALEDGKILYSAHVMPRVHPTAWEVLVDWTLPEADCPPWAALGMVETLGYAGAFEAADAGVKAADVTLANYYIVGSGYTTVIFRGDVSAVESAVQAARECATRIADVKAAHTIPAPHPGLHRHLYLGTAKENLPEIPPEPGRALGYLETRGLVSLIEATDRALKAAAVEMLAWNKIGSAFVYTLLRGEVSSVQAAVEAGAEAAERVGELLAVNVIARPEEGVGGVK